MNFFSAIKRFWQLISIAIRYNLDEYLPQNRRFLIFRIFLRLHPQYYRKRSALDKSLATRTRLALEDLGPIFVKFGQTLSTRPDLINEEYLRELSLLQDKVPPFSSEIAKKNIEKALSKDISELFLSFDDKPLASASVAQVHAAKLLDGREVIIKVLRPDVRKIVQKDLDLLYFLANLAQISGAKRLRPREVIQEFENTLNNELDLLSEAANASQLRANFQNSDLLYVPEIHWQFCRREILVMERIFAVNIADNKALAAAKVNMKVLAEKGVKIFFLQVFRDSFFHADMHPGNIFVDISNPENPRYCAIDFGIMGSLTPEDQHYLAENFLAFFNRDYRRVAELHLESEWIPAKTRVTDFEAAIRKVSEPIFGKPIKDISFGAFLLSLFQTARRFDMHIQPQLVLLQKTFFNVEGLGRRLYPDLDLWTTAKPVLEDWMSSQIGVKAFLKRFRTYAHDYAKVLPELPLLQAQLIRKQLISKKNNYFFSGLFFITLALILFFSGLAKSTSANFVILLLLIYGFYLHARKD